AQVHLATGEPEAALQALDEVLLLGRRMRDERTEASALHLAARVLLELPEGSRTKVQKEQSEIGKSQAADLPFLRLGRGASRSLPTDPLQAATEAVEAFRSVGDEPGLASALRTLCAAHLQKKSAARAVAASKECCGLLRQVGDRWGEADALLQLATALLEAGCPQEAQESAESAQDLSMKLGDKHRQSLAQDLLQLARQYDDSFRSGLWTSGGKGHAAKIASGIGGVQARAATAKNESQPKSDTPAKRFSPAVLFDRKPFPWRSVPEPAASRARKADEDIPWSPSAAEAEQSSEFRPAPRAAQGPVRGQEVGVWRCGACGLKTEDPGDGARAGADGDFQWFCRTCWRSWVDGYLKEARSSGKAGKGGKAKGKGRGSQPESKPWPQAKAISREELQQMSLIELYKQARATGADFKQLSVAMESDNPKSGLVELLRPRV
ncbi:unnamed protein product, partial [Polarella glacialis]